VSYVLIVIVAVCNIVSVLAFKAGVTHAGGIGPADLAHPLTIMTKIITTPLLLVGLASSCTTTVIWLMVLSRVQANVAVPLMNGIYYLLLLVISTLVLGESVTPGRITAIGLIIVSAALLTR
jgi:drug/metabolite transporter (DMT)-like permease